MRRATKPQRTLLHTFIILAVITRNLLCARDTVITVTRLSWKHEVGRIALLEHVAKYISYVNNTEKSVAIF